MTIGSSSSGDNAASGANDGPQLVKDSYIVTLKQDLGKDAYERHFEDVYNRCQAVGGMPTAGIERIYSYPIDHDQPTSVMYFAHFPQEIAAMISRLSAVENIHQEHLGSADIAGTQPTPSRSWGPGYISQTDADFQAQYNAGQQDFIYNQLPTGGDGCTVYVIDYGYLAADLVNQELAPQRHEFMDADEYKRKLDAIKKAGPSPWLPWYWCKSWKEERLDAAHGHIAKDARNLHGTNASLCVGSDIRGTAPRAHVVTIRATQPFHPDYRRLAEKRVLDALQMIDDQDPGNKAIINCSWSFDFTTEINNPLNEMEAMKSRFKALHQKGVSIVATAGNESGKTLKNLDIHVTTGPYRNVNLFVPLCLKYVYVVGSLSYENDEIRKSAFSNYIRMTDQKRPENPFFLAPGEDLLGFGLQANPGDPQDELAEVQAGPAGQPLLVQKECSGTSFAAPLFSGVLACVIAGKTEGTPIDVALGTVTRQQDILACGQQKILSWDTNP